MVLKRKKKIKHRIWGSLLSGCPLTFSSSGYPRLNSLVSTGVFTPSHIVQIPPCPQAKKPHENLHLTRSLICPECHRPPRICLILLLANSFASMFFCLFVLFFLYFVRSSCCLQEDSVIRELPGHRGEEEGHETCPSSFPRPFSPLGPNKKEKSLMSLPGPYE